MDFLLCEAMPTTLSKVLSNQSGVVVIARSVITSACLLTLCSCDFVSADLTHYVTVRPEVYDSALRHARSFTTERDGILVPLRRLYCDENYIVLADPEWPIDDSVSLSRESGCLVLGRIWINRVPDGDELARAERFQIHVYRALRSRMPELPPVAQLQRWHWDWSEGDRPQSPFDSTETR